MFPRRVALFAQLSHGVAKIAAGATFSLAVTKHKMLYLWGQQGVCFTREENGKQGGSLPRR